MLLEIVAFILLLRDRHAQKDDTILHFCASIEKNAFLLKVYIKLEIIQLLFGILIVILFLVWTGKEVTL